MDLEKMLKEAEKLQSMMSSMQENLKGKKIKVSAGGVHYEVNGLGDTVKVKLDEGSYPGVSKEILDKIAKDIKEANDMAKEKTQEVGGEAMDDMTKNMQLDMPEGFFDEEKSVGRASKYSNEDVNISDKGQSGGGRFV